MRMKKYRIDVTPHRSLLEKIGSASFSIAESIGELVANSLDAVVGGKHAEIDVDVSLNRIEVKDNGRGMDLDTLKLAVRMAWPMEEIIPYGAGRKRVYGLGMKTACASLGRRWTVVTTPANDPNAYRVTFDFDEWSSGDSSSWSVDVEVLPKNQAGFISQEPSGTRVIVEKLRVRPIVAKIKEDLSLIYAPHLEQGDAIRVNGESLECLPPQLDEETRMEISVDVDGHPIRGWGALMVESSQKNLYGFHLYRRGQLVEKFDKSFIRVHPTSARIIGELHLDHVPVNFTKKGFEKESREWKRVVSELREIVKPLVTKARKKKGKLKRKPQEESKTNDVLEVIDTIVGPTAEASLGDDNPTDYVLDGIVESFLSAEVVEKDEGTPILGKSKTFRIGDEKWKCIHHLAPLGAHGPIWDYHIINGNTLHVVTNTDSSLYRESEDVHLVCAFAVADSILKYLVTERDFDFQKALRFRDTLLNTTLASYLESKST